MHITEKQIIIALDGMTRDQAISMAWLLSGRVWGFKINDLLLTYGAEIVQQLHCLGNIFVDLKLHDTPNTVNNNIRILSQTGADLITVHASGGMTMIKEAVKASGSAKIIAVTILTSTADHICEQVYHRKPAETTWDLAHIAKDAGADGIVCSVNDLANLAHLNILKIVTNCQDNQTCKLPQGADLIVVGRPITQAVDPLTALSRLVKGDSNV